MGNEEELNWKEEENHAEPVGSVHTPFKIRLSPSKDSLRMYDQDCNAHPSQINILHFQHL